MYILLVTLLMSLLVAGPAVAGMQPRSEQPPGPQDKAQIRQAQERLQAFGFNPGPQNGDMNDQTVRALRQFQKARGLPETGMLDAATHQALFSQPSGPSGRTPQGIPRPR